MIKPIRNPFCGTPNAGCFVCGAANAEGLHLEFFEDGDDVVTTWEPEHRFAGYGVILHGGIQSTILDEIAAWAVFVKLRTAGVTQRMEVEFRSPVYLDRGTLRFRARLPEVDGKTARVPAELIDGSDRVCTRATVTYRLFPEKLAREKLLYPGYEAFVQ